MLKILISKEINNVDNDNSVEPIAGLCIPIGWVFKIRDKLAKISMKKSHYVIPKFLKEEMERK